MEESSSSPSSSGTSGGGGTDDARPPPPPPGGGGGGRDRRPHHPRPRRSISVLSKRGLQPAPPLGEAHPAGGAGAGPERGPRDLRGLPAGGQPLRVALRRLGPPGHRVRGGGLPGAHPAAPGVPHAPPRLRLPHAQRAL